MSIARFEASIVFQTWDGALEAVDALRDAGFQAAINADQVDIYSQATFVDVSRASDVDLWEDVEAIVGPFSGDVAEAGLVQAKDDWSARYERTTLPVSRSRQ